MGKYWSQQQAKEGNRVQFNQYQNNLKQGIWKEEIYDKQFQVFEMGDYFKGQRIGKWICCYNNIQIAGGFYDDKGKKQGKWSVISNIFENNRQVIYCGEYNTIGKKLGLWDTMYFKSIQKDYKQMQILFYGCGSYDQEGNQNKIGKWVELFEGFWNNAQVIYNGEYNMNGIKVGKWDIMYCKWNEKEYKHIGGGSYDSLGDQKKIGKWVELDEKFDFEKQVIYNGKYNMNGKKVDRWNIKYCKYKEKKYKQLGGGSYDQEGNEKKVGNWVELDESFYRYQQITLNGQYDIKGQKVGIWVKMDIYDKIKFGKNNYDN